MIRPRTACGAISLKKLTPGRHVETANLLERVYAAYDEDAFHKVYRAIYDFATIELSSFYFDILKDRLYTSPVHSVRRRAAQTTLYRIADALVRAVAPLMCFTAEEVWSHLPQRSVRVSPASTWRNSFRPQACAMKFRRLTGRNLTTGRG